MQGSYVSHLRSNGGITIIFNGRDPVTIATDNHMYDEIVALLGKGKYTQVPDAVDKAFKEVQKEEPDYVDPHGRFVVNKGVVNMGGTSMPKPLGTRLVELAKLNLNIDPLLKFWKKCEEHPSVESVKDLYEFLEKNHVPITSDGCFVGYRSVRSNMTDHYTGKFDNSPGKVLKMPREKVNADRNVTCSTGFHIAAYKYADDFKSNGTIVEVKVNPKNVVSVPRDYNSQKMRVCEYEVIKLNKGGKLKEKIYSGTRKGKARAKPSGVIRRLSAEEKYLYPDKKGSISVTTAIMEKVGLNTGDTMYVCVPTQRNRSVVISSRKPKGKPHYIRELKVGVTSTRIFPAPMVAAQIETDDWYELTISKGNLIIK